MKKKYLALFLLCVQVLGHSPILVAEEAGQSMVSALPVTSEEGGESSEVSSSSEIPPSLIPSLSPSSQSESTASSSSSEAVSVDFASSSSDGQTVGGLSPSTVSSSTGQASQRATAETIAGASVAPVAEEVEEQAMRETTASTAIVPLYRLYHPELRVHLYTKDTNEYAILGTRGWNQEGLAWNTADNKGDTVYRLYHAELRVHLYTKDTNEYRVLATRGWKQEGGAFRSFGETPIYRLYHSGLRKHLYTKDTNEYRILATRGWKQEGVAFYGLGASTPTPPVPSSPTKPSTASSSSSKRRDHIYLSYGHTYEDGTSSYTSQKESGALILYGPQDKVPSFKREGYRIKEARLMLFYSYGNGGGSFPLRTWYLEDLPTDAHLTYDFLNKLDKREEYPATHFELSVTWEKIPTQPVKKSVMLAWWHELSSGSWTAATAAENPFKNNNSFTNGTIFSDRDTIPAIRPTGYRVTKVQLRLRAEVNGEWKYVTDYSDQAPKDGTMTWAFLEKLAANFSYESFYFDWRVTWEKAPVTPQQTVTKTQKRVTLPHKTIRQANASLWEGEEKVTRQGVDGYQLIEVTTTKDNQTGKVTTSERVLETKPATDKIVSYGTKKRYTTTSVSIEEVVNFTTKTIYDANLEQGKTEIRQVGINGQKVIRVTTIVDNKTGEKTERREVVSQTSAQEEVIAVGTKKPVVTTPSGPTKKTVTLDEFLAMSEDDQDAFLAGGGTFDSPELRGTVNQATLDKIETVINVTKLNEELVRLMNEERAKLGRSAVTYAGKDSTLQDAVDTRANEMALHGSLRYQDKVEGAHKRPDGSDWRTAASAEHAAKVIWQGENSLQLGRAIAVFSASDETKLAQTLFRNWMDSSGHRRLMMRDGDYQMAVSVAMGSKTYGSSQDDAGVTIAILQIAKLRP